MPIAKAHQPCDACGSSDAKSYYSNGATHCFACNAHTPPTEDGEEQEVSSNDDATLTTPRSRAAKQRNYTAIPERCITSATASTYTTAKEGDKVIFGYCDGNGSVVATKTRTGDKEFFTDNFNATKQLFGQWLFPAGGARKLTLVEGEFDALAAYQMQGSKYPVVSIRNGATGAVKDCKQVFEWLDSFDEIVIAFDSDEPGQKAAKEVAALFGGKASIMKHAADCKDACDYLKAGKTEEFKRRWWQAEQYKPDGIRNGTELYEEATQPVQKADAYYPFSDLNKVTYGIRQGELVVYAAGSGVGKSQFLREIIYNILKTTDANVGLIFLEEGEAKTARSLMSLAVDKPLHLPDTETTEAELTTAFDATLGTGRLFFAGGFEAASTDEVLSHIRYMAKALDCEYIFLDHITMLVSGQDNQDERKALDAIMTKTRKLVESTGVSLHAVTHLKRPEKKGHEEGAAVTLAQLRGSGAIAHLSDIVIGLERNGQAEDEDERNTTRIKVLKNRFSGDTGPAGYALYSKQTGRMVDCIPNDPMEEGEGL